MTTMTNTSPTMLAIMPSSRGLANQPVAARLLAGRIEQA